VLPSLLVEFFDGIDAGPEEDHGVLENSKQIHFLSFFLFWWYWGLNSGPQACYAGTLRPKTLPCIGHSFNRGRFSKLKF
jgi:hypothetical protein